MAAIAHYRTGDKTPHPLDAHLREVAALASQFAGRLGCSAGGELMGILHDLGKYSTAFQAYIASANGLVNPDDEDWIDARSQRGRIDHSTAGAQRIWQALAGRGDEASRRAAQVLALCVASHHGGLMDSVEARSGAPAVNRFEQRMAKPDHDTHLLEVERAADAVIRDRVETLLAERGIVDSLHALFEDIATRNPSAATRTAQQGLATRLLFSCLIDADRISTADFKHEQQALQRPGGFYRAWPVLCQRLESHLDQLNAHPVNPVDVERRGVTEACLVAANRAPGGTHLLAVPTGGGKTLASLRFALHHAARYKLDRIVFVLPLTAIIDQNADVVRKALEPDDAPEDSGRIVLEHHSNLTPEHDTFYERLVAENWDAPVVFTTMVQFLEACFGSGTRGPRRMHQLANAVIIFDEIQMLPVRCAHLFANAINLLAEQGRSTILFSTATQPLLDQIDSKQGAVRLQHEPLVPQVAPLFERLRRVDVHSDLTPQSAEEIATLASNEIKLAQVDGAPGTCLVVANTRRSARELYAACATLVDKEELFFLSGDMCAAHRRQRLGVKTPEAFGDSNTIFGRLASGLPTLCVSTQVIEAGVDVDFDSVVRCLAGLDSIAQAAGRCNRNSRRPRGRVTVVRLQGERLDTIEDIRTGASATERVLREFADDPAAFGGDLLGPASVERYYRYYFFERSDVMAYPVDAPQLGRTDTLLNLLSTNTKAVRDLPAAASRPFLAQSFRTAGELFEAIAPTDGVVIPFGEEGEALVDALRQAGDDPQACAELLRRAQPFSVSVYPRALEALLRAGAVEPIRQGLRVYLLRSPDHYHDEFGLDNPEPDRMVALVR